MLNLPYPVVLATRQDDLQSALILIMFDAIVTSRRSRSTAFTSRPRIDCGLLWFD